MNNCVRTNLFSAFDCIWLLERLPQVSAQREHTIVTDNVGYITFGYALGETTACIEVGLILGHVTT